MAFRASWSRIFSSSRTASSLARVRLPRSSAAIAVVVVSGSAPSIETSPRVAHLGTQVVAMKLAQLVARDSPQPEENGIAGCRR